MENNQMKQTKFDSIVTTLNMQLLKAVIPYIDRRLGRYIGIMIKFQEFQNALNLKDSYNFTDDDTEMSFSLENMLNDIKELLNEDEQQAIDELLSMVEMMKAMNMDEETMNMFMESAFSNTGKD